MAYALGWPVVVVELSVNSDRAELDDKGIKFGYGRDFGRGTTSLFQVSVTTHAPDRPLIRQLRQKR